MSYCLVAPCDWSADVEAVQRKPLRFQEAVSKTSALSKANNTVLNIS